MYPWTNIVGDFCTKFPIVHQQYIQILNIPDNEFLKAIGKVVLGCFVRAIADFWHFLITSEPSSHSVIDSCIKNTQYL